MSELHNKIIEYFKNKDNPIILDIGCYLGEDSNEFNILFPNSRIWMFEADPRNCSLIKKGGLLINENIKLIEGAISNYNGECDFYPSETIDWSKIWRLSGSIKKPYKHLEEYTVSFGKSIKIPCQTLDHWYNNSAIYEKIIELAYIDLNGAEREFLEGSTEILHYIHLLYIECFDKEMYQGQVNCEWVNDYLSKFGFKYLMTYGHNHLYERTSSNN